MDINAGQLATADDCAEQLRIAAGEANKMAASAVGYGQMAIRYAIKAGEIMNRAKELLAHGKFLSWLSGQLEVVQVTERTAQKWMRLANANNGSDLMDSPDTKTITDAYRATGILPDPEPKNESGEGRDRPVYSLTFRTTFRMPDDWTEKAARDFLYEFDQLNELADMLRERFRL